MGWYEHPKLPGVMIGDEAFDVTHDFLVRLRDLYQASFQRAPTLQEASALLETALRVSGGEVLGELEDKRVTQIVVKTEKKPRDQPFAVGDVFAIPAATAHSRFAFGRIMMAEKGKPLLVEVFREPARTMDLKDSVLASGRLFHPVQVAPGDAFKSWRWTVVRSDPAYAMSADDQALEFSSQGPVKGHVAVNLRGKILRTIGEEEANRMERGWAWDAPALEERVRKALASA